MIQKKALIGMSGGVDSSVAALLTLQAGYSCIGATMRLYDNSTAGVSAILPLSTISSSSGIK